LRLMLRSPEPTRLNWIAIGCLCLVLTFLPESRAANSYSIECVSGTIPPDPSGLTNTTCNSTAEAYQCYAGLQLDGTIELACTTPQVCQQIYNALYGQSPVSSPYSKFFCCSTNFCNDYKQLNRTQNPVVPPPGNYTPSSEGGGGFESMRKGENTVILAILVLSELLFWVRVV